MGQDKWYGDVVLGKGRFSKDVPLCYHCIHYNSISYMFTIHVHVDLSLRGFLPVFAHKVGPYFILMYADNFIFFKLKCTTQLNM